MRPHMSNMMKTPAEKRRNYVGYMVFLFNFVSNKTYIEQYVKYFLCVKQIRKTFMFL